VLFRQFQELRILRGKSLIRLEIQSLQTVLDYFDDFDDILADQLDDERDYPIGAGVEETTDGSFTDVPIVMAGVNARRDLQLLAGEIGKRAGLWFGVIDAIRDVHRLASDQN
jgi:hypothetical protein